jgi:hypothetical protein
VSSGTLESDTTTHLEGVTTMTKAAIIISAILVFAGVAAAGTLTSGSSSDTPTIETPTLLTSTGDDVRQEDRRADRDELEHAACVPGAAQAGSPSG